MNKAKFVREITVKDPDTKGEVSLSVYKHPNGGIFAIDSSFVDQMFDEDEKVIILDPLAQTEFTHKKKVLIELVEE